MELNRYSYFCSTQQEFHKNEEIAPASEEQDGHKKTFRIRRFSL